MDIALNLGYRCIELDIWRVNADPSQVVSRRSPAASHTRPATPAPTCPATRPATSASALGSRAWSRSGFPRVGEHSANLRCSQVRHGPTSKLSNAVPLIEMLDALERWMETDESCNE
eukprot:6104731-Prymnesium_polylepis.1